jgi:hypothetical protein
MAKRKKQSRRSKEDYPELDPKYSLKTRADLVDQDYVNKLSKKEREWLNKFNKEYVSASLDNDSPKKNLHRSKRLRKDCYDRNNSRNRCVLTREKAQNALIDFDGLLEEKSHDSYEDLLISKIDTSETREAIEWLADEAEEDETYIEDKLISETNE